MLTISQGVLAELEGSLSRQRKARFVRWAASFSNLIGDFSADRCREAFDGFLEDAVADGVGADERFFEYVAAHLIMPHMNGLQYFKALDVIFSNMAQIDRMKMLVYIRDQPNG